MIAPANPFLKTLKGTFFFSLSFAICFSFSFCLVSLRNKLLVILSIPPPRNKKSNKTTGFVKLLTLSFASIWTIFNKKRVAKTTLLFFQFFNFKFYASCCTIINSYLFADFNTCNHKHFISICKHRNKISDP